MADSPAFFFGPVRLWLRVALVVLRCHPLPDRWGNGQLGLVLLAWSAADFARIYLNWRTYALWLSGGLMGLSCADPACTAPHAWPAVSDCARSAYPPELLYEALFEARRRFATRMSPAMGRQIDELLRPLEELRAKQVRQKLGQESLQERVQREMNARVVGPYRPLQRVECFQCGSTEDASLVMATVFLCMDRAACQTRVPRIATCDLGRGGLLDARSVLTPDGLLCAACGAEFQAQAKPLN